MTHISVRSINITAQRQLQCCVSDERKSAEINQLQLTDSSLAGLRLIKIVHESPQKLFFGMDDDDDSVTQN